ncbi:competence/damage-inducible protein A [Microcoleus sp. FACHB-68]|uniref:competence/damage-inducible protein A n=1 Tax=Microcoleus sp. FACHB-68 TaxID=2692826 RepID=UPI0016884DD9|nr:competence/damage-inducible protein A [Microcoleus sp. FACHB-68]MBD1939905.1 competence/damage-inducible protein A [Microcoleus sp. FACHB-68]
MSAEIICVGTELLLGDILNSNAQFLAKQLAQLGIPHYFQTVVGDNPDRLKQVLAIACERSQVLIFTGGLGPTPDDLTHETLADFFGVPLVERAEILEDIAHKYAQRGRQMAPSNRKQALIPRGAEILPNPAGTAPGIIWQPRAGLSVLTFPGVPGEMYGMWRETAVPYLKSQGWGQAIIYSRTLKFWGIAESTLAEKVSAFLNLPNPTVAPYASRGEVKLRISARAGSEMEAIELITPVEKQLQQIAGLDYYGADDETLPVVVGRLLQNAGETLVVAESCTGGGLGQMLTEVAGSSNYFLGGVISYDNQVKISLLGVNSEDLEQLGAVSDPVAKQMASGVRSRLGAGWGLSITGIAGPGGGSETKPVGLVYIGLAGPAGEVESFEYRFGALRDRALIRHISACAALDHLRRKLLSRQPIENFVP